jgi:hypothetical protein
MTQTYYSQSSSKLPWRYLAIGSLGFWLSTSLLLDLAILPTLWLTGMMDSAGFASAGYSIFWIFNRLELLCAAILLTTVFASPKVAPQSKDRQLQLSIGGMMLMAIACCYTFYLAPMMSGLSVHLDWFATTSPIFSTEMARMHAIYWVLEASKLGIISLLLYHNTQIQE